MPEIKTITKRPRIVTIISWFFIIYALISVIPKIFVIINPEAYQLALEWNQAYSNIGYIHVPLSFQLAHALVGALVTLVCGVFMLKSRAWARNFLIIWMLGVLVITFLVVGFSFQIYAKSIFLIIIILLLYRSAAADYFKGN